MVRAATSLGRSGLHDWLIQRLSAVVMLAYVLYLMGYLIGAYMVQPELSYSLWHGFFARPFVKIASLLALLAVVAHAWIGIWTVFTDYVKPVALRVVLQSLLIVTCLGLLFWGFIILWGV